MTTQTIRNGTSIEVVIPTGQTLKVVAVSGTYNASVVRGTGIGTTLSSLATGASYGPYAYDSVVRLVSSDASEIDFDVAVTPDVATDTVANYAFDPLTGAVTGLVGPGGVPFFPSYLPEFADNALDLPGTIAGLELWLDASEPMYTASYAARVATSADTVAIWPDKSGKGSGRTFAVNGAPKYSPAGHNGKPAVSFNGTTDYFTISGLLTTAFDSAFSLFVVANRTDVGGANLVSVGTTTPTNFYAQRNTTTNDTGLTASGLTGGTGIVRTTNQAFSEMYVYTGSTLSVFADGFSRGESTASSSNPSGSMTIASTGATTLNSQVLGIGAISNGTGKWLGTISEVLLYSTALSDTDQKRVLKYLAKKWGASSRRAVTCVGDSVTSGSGSTGSHSQAVSIAGTNYPARLWALLGASGYQVRVDAYPGRTLAQVLSDSQLSQWVSQTEAAQGVTVLWAGSNTLTIGKSVGAAIQQLQRACLSYRASGQKVVVCTTMPRQDAGIYAAFEADRLTLNAFVRANYRKFADGLADIGADVRLQNPLDTTYFYSDNVHLNDAGYSLVASIVAPVVSAI